MTVLKLIGRRLLLLPVSLFVLITLSFGLVELMPGNPAVTVAGNFASPEEIAATEQRLGLDRPLVVRYLDYLGHAVQGDLGTSFFTGQPILTELGNRLPATIELVVLALAFSAVFGLLLGTISAYLRRSWYDRFSRGVVSVLQSVPDFVLALGLIYLLFYLAGVAPPPVGRIGLGADSVPTVTRFLLIDTLLAGRPDLFVEALRHLMLPVIALGVVYAAFFAKMTRSTMVPALNSSQVEFARACGLSEWQVIRYAYLQARAPIITYGAILFGSLVGGAAIVETIFSWQGAGQWALDSILAVDMPAIQGFVLATGVITIVLYLLLDVMVMLLDPRVRYE
jgi:peptide/nickel transport system permease protein